MTLLQRTMGMALAVVIMSGSPAAAGTTYYVRTDGHDSNCTGQTDAPYTSGNACAFRTPQRALNAITCSAGDDVMIKAGTFGPDAGTNYLTIPSPCVASVGDPVVITAPFDSTFPSILDASTTQQGVLYSSGNLQHVQITNLRIQPGYDFGIRTDGSDNRNVVVSGNKFTSMPDLCCADNANGVVVFLGGLSGYCSNCSITNNILEGSPNTTVNAVTGTDAMAFRLSPSASVPTSINRISGNAVTNILGSFVGGNCTRTIIETNRLDGSACLGDDGCIQVYNSVDCTVRYNVFKNVVPDESYGPAFIQVRTTDETDATKRANVTAYNNTFHGKLGVYLAGAKRILSLHDTIHPQSQASRFVNNILMEGFGADRVTCGGSVESADKHALYVFDCPDAGAVVDWNLTWKVGQCETNQSQFFYSLSLGYDAADCSLSSTHNKFGFNPSLNASYEPTISNAPPCGNGTTSVTAFDGDQSKSYIGAKQGACGPCGPCQIEYCTGVEIGCRATGTCGIGGCCNYQCGIELPSCIDPECPPNVCGGCGGW